MATKKRNHHYVLVLTNTGPVFVTGTKPHHYAEFDKLEKPLEFSKSVAEDICLGLNLNFITAYYVCVPYELDAQPYRYDLGDFKWERKE